MEMHHTAALRQVHGIDARAVHANSRRLARAFVTKLAAWIANAVRTAVAQYERGQERWQAMKELQRLDDRMLADIGLTRGSIPDAVETGRWRQKVRSAP